MADSWSARCACVTMTNSRPSSAPCRWLTAAASVALLLTAFGAGAAETRVAAYDARYSVYRNGKLTGRMDVELERKDGRWTARSEGSGTHGLARLLGARDSEETVGRVHRGQFRPERYQRHTRVAALDDEWVVDFDWARRQVRIVRDGDDGLLLDMTEDALDPLTLKLEMRRRLLDAGPELVFQMVEEDEIDEQRFRLLPREWLETSLGCLLTQPVEKIRQNSARYTRAWHAPALDFVEVRMEHGKTGGEHLEMRIAELSVGGETVVPAPGCAARQREGPGP